MVFLFPIPSAWIRCFGFVAEKFTRGGEGLRQPVMLAGFLSVSLYNWMGDRGFTEVSRKVF